MLYTDLKNRIFALKDEGFDATALDVFRFQAAGNEVYGKYLDLLKVDPQAVQSIKDIPFLPISFFKTHLLKSIDHSAVQVFESSGTSDTVPSRHALLDASIYQESILTGFERVYGSVRDFRIFALLPSYLERENASLVYMFRYLMEQSGHQDNGFYLNFDEELKTKLLSDSGATRTLVIGVTYALLDFAEKFKLDLSNTVVMETGGMKGRRKEITRQELHRQLKSSFNVDRIHSEYGMTELFSQAYLMRDEIFQSPPWMKILTRDLNDPLQILAPGQSGAINVIDLANLGTCSFIATDDLGRTHSNNEFEVLGRVDHSDLRGCSLLTEE